MAEFKDLEGQTLVDVHGAYPRSERIIFEASDGRSYVLHHHQDCCERVDVNDIVGDINDIIGTPILRAEEASNSDEPSPFEYSDSHTWTFYKLATVRGSVTIRWIGDSNGYYSERVSFENF